MKIKLNQNLSTPKGKLLKGDIVNLECDKNNMPLNIFWRRRLKDSAIDKCIEIIEKSKIKK